MATNNIDSKQIIRLIVKEFTEGLSDQEIEALNAWINASNENKDLYHKFYSEEYRKRRLEIGKQFDVKNGWQKVVQEIHPKQKSLVPKQVLRAVSVAASVILIVGLFYLFNKPDTDAVIPTAYENIQPGTNKAVLTLAGGNKIELNDLDTLIQASGININVKSKELVYKDETEDVGNHLVYNILETPKGGKYNLTLSDGTKVWLNAASKLRYPEKFIGDKRSVFVEGEAYFEVAKDASKPFFVHSGNNVVRVLGTAFNVRAYRETAQTRITLCEGSIELTSGQHINILTPNQQAVINNKTYGTVINKVDSKLFTAWKDGMFMFRRAKLNDILVDLSRWYNVNLFYTNQNIKNKEFSLYMNRQETIQNILEMLETTEEISFSIKDNNIIVSPK